MIVEIIKYDNLGRGISYLNGKIVFVPKSVINDILEIEITSDKKNYSEGIIKKIIKPSPLRIKAICPYFSLCGGCDLMQLDYKYVKEYKIKKVNDIFNKEIIKEKDYIDSKNQKYRNKISLKIKDRVVGYYENNSHDIVKIDNCLIASDAINEVLKNINYLGIINGEVTIRSNYNSEILLIIKSMDNINYDYLVNNYNIVGIIYNDKLVYGKDYFYEKINDYVFKVSYNSFFQVNSYINAKLFDLLKEYTKNSVNVLDLYCGVGTLGIVASNSGNTLGVEIIDNAIKDALVNKKLNNKKNIDFICSDTNNIIDEINNSFDTLILDPPRSGVSKKVIDKIMVENINTIIYISCNPATLKRDIDLLKDKYNIKNIKLLDMFPYTEHIECITVLERR